MAGVGAPASSAHGAGPAPAGLCERGQRQSPIDIVATQRQALPPLQFRYLPAPLHAVNDGHTVRLRGFAGSRLLIGNQSHTLEQVHFHRPGGDRVQGEDFALSLHFLHKSAAGQLVALVVLFRVGAESPVLAPLLPLLPRRGQAALLRPELSIDPARLLPASPGYYAYDGSLTAPPCTEGVRWIVMKQVLEISAAQLAQLAERVPVNARPVQPLHARIVSESP